MITDHRITASSTPIVVTPVGDAELRHFVSRRPSAAFLAQLIATRQAAPQTRPRNRAEPREAAAAYGRASGMTRRPPRP